MDTAEKRKLVVDRIKSVTARFEREIREEKAVPSIHPRVKEIKASIDLIVIPPVQEWAIGFASALTGIPEALLGGEPRIPRPPPLVAAVIQKNPNDHNYRLGDVVVFGNRKAYAIRPDGSWGNNAPLDASAIRMATPDEIDRVTEAQVEAVTEFLVFA